MKKSKQSFFLFPFFQEFFKLAFPDPNAATATDFKAGQVTQVNKIIHVPAAAIKELSDLVNIQNSVFCLFHNIPINFSKLSAAKASCLLKPGKNLFSDQDLKQTFFLFPFVHKGFKFAFFYPDTVPAAYFQCGQFTHINKVIHLASTTIEPLPNRVNIQKSVFCLFHNLPQYRF